jgi:hypothetical protein
MLQDLLSILLSLTMTSQLTARSICPSQEAKIVKPPKPSTLLTDPDVEASRGLLDMLTGKEDVSAINKARYIAPKGAKIVKPPKTSTLPQTSCPRHPEVYSIFL